MTNSEIYQETAIEKLANGELNSCDAEFIERISGYNKKELRSLSSAEFKLLRNIAR